MTIISKIKGTNNTIYNIQDKTSSGVTAGDYGPTGDPSLPLTIQIAHGENFIVPYFTVNTYGKITAASNKTITLPSDNNTDTLVTQTQVTTSNTGNYPILLAPNGQTSNTTTTSYFSSNFYFTPSTQVLKTNVLQGFINEEEFNDASGVTGIGYKLLEGTTEPEPLNVIHMAWDNTGGYDSQLGFSGTYSSSSTVNNKAYVRGQNAGVWGTWYELLTNKNLNLIDVSSRIQSINTTYLTKPSNYTIGHKTWSNGYSTTDFSLPSNSSAISGLPIFTYTTSNGHITSATTNSLSSLDNYIIPKNCMRQSSPQNSAGMIYVFSPNNSVGTLIQWGQVAITQMTSSTTIGGNTMYYGDAIIDLSQSDLQFSKKPNVFVQWAANYATLRSLNVRADTLSTTRIEIRGYASTSVSAARNINFIAIGLTTSRIS